LIFVSVLFIAPLVFVILTSLMTDQQANTKELWPHPFVWSNYTSVFSAIPFWRYVFNTLMVAFLSTAGVVLSSITHRDTARLYCKQVVDGRGEHLLSPEEDEAIRRALAGERGSAVLED